MQAWLQGELSDQAQAAQSLCKPTSATSGFGFSPLMLVHDEAYRLIQEPIASAAAIRSSAGCTSPCRGSDREPFRSPAADQAHQDLAYSVLSLHDAPLHKASSQDCMKAGKLSNHLNSKLGAWRQEVGLVGSHDQVPQGYPGGFCARISVPGEHSSHRSPACSITFHSA